MVMGGEARGLPSSWMSRFGNCPRLVGSSDMSLLLMLRVKRVGVQRLSGSRGPMPFLLRLRICSDAAPPALCRAAAKLSVPFCPNLFLCRYSSFRRACCPTAAPRAAAPAGPIWFPARLSSRSPVFDLRAWAILMASPSPKLRPLATSHRVSALRRASTASSTVLQLTTAPWSDAASALPCILPSASLLQTQISVTSGVRDPLGDSPPLPQPGPSTTRPNFASSTSEKAVLSLLTAPPNLERAFHKGALLLSSRFLC
mmetsp:Transcript_12576/g.29398  ORF Transcript_12576/g.29398 Transcript_12576/m.29398 type:complete len:257 (-) Transcript_12576:45-815(-)